MGLSRNKVAVSEGAAGSPPFYGESNLAEINCRAEIEREKITDRDEKVITKSLVVRFSGDILNKKQKRKKQQKQNPYGGVAQLGEHLPCKQGVMGSNPIISTRDEQSLRGTKGQGTVTEWAHSSGG